jgi:hypothetical protein
MKKNKWHAVYAWLQVWFIPLWLIGVVLTIVLFGK